jgi:crotonobetainyl-CoA:carnitine CoA-transferase CaiB-like acyl-CoA transferase
MMRVELPSENDSRVSVVANPLKMSASPVEYRSAPPRLGQQTQQVLRELLSLDDERIEALARDSVIRL